jgi:hypothetical protein
MYPGSIRFPISSLLAYDFMNIFLKSSLLFPPFDGWLELVAASSCFTDDFGTAAGREAPEAAWTTRGTKTFLPLR